MSGGEYGGRTIGQKDGLAAKSTKAVLTVCASKEVCVYG